MEFCVTVKNDSVVIDGVKDPETQQKISNLTKTYLCELYKLLSEPMDVQLSSLIHLTPKEELCCICLEDCVGTSGPPVSPKCECEGTYHRKCLETWYRKKKVCPTCRKRFNNKDKGYRETTYRNPYETSRGGVSMRNNSPSQSKYICCGGTHPRRSSFKTLDSALKHAKDKHSNAINYTLMRGGMWRCLHEGCDAIEDTYTEDAYLEHLQERHHIRTIEKK